jgi:auxin-responsive protein IAA
MSPTLEPHDYIGLSAAAAAAAAGSPTPTSSSSCSSSPNPAGGETGPRLTLRLGLPGSESPDRDTSADVAAALTLGLVSHKPASSKRAFPDASPRRGPSSAAADKAPSAAPPAAK